VQTFSSNAAIKELKRAIELGHDEGSALLQLGKAYQQKNEVDNILMEVIIKDSQPTHLKANLYAMRADAHLRKNDPKQALNDLNEAKKLDVNATDVRLAWAQYEKFNKDIDAQIKWLKPLLESADQVADAWSQMGEIEQQTNNLEAAEQAYTKAIELRGIVHLDTLKRALIRIAQINYAQAQSDINILKKAGADWPMVGYAEGLIAFYQENYNSAQSLFENVLSKYPDYSPARLLTGLTHFYKGNYQSAVTNLEIYLTTFPEASQANFIFSASLLKLNKPAEAISVLLKLKRAEPDNFKVLSLLGNAYLMNKQNDKSVEVLTKAVELNPEQAQARLQLGSVLLRDETGQESAQRQLIKAIELDPKLYQADYVLFMSYIRSKNFLKARGVAEALSKKQPENSLGTNLIALSYLANGNKQLAIEELKRTLQTFPSDPSASNNLGRIYLQDGKLTEAREVYLSVLKKNPADLQSLNQLALIETREGNREKAMEWLVQAAEKNPDSFPAKLQLANQYILNQDFVTATQLLQNAKAEEKQSPNYVLLMAKAKMGMNENQHATRLLKSLVAQNPASSSAHFLLAQSYANQNDKKNMRESLLNTVKASPEHFPANLALARLDLFDNNVDSFVKRTKELVLAFPDSPDVKFLNAKVLSSEKKYDNAIKNLSELMSNIPSSGIAVDLSRNQWNSGDRSSAISTLELWLQENKEDKNALMLLSQFYLAESRVSEAKNTYQSLDELLPNNATVLNNLAWLMMDTDVKQGIIYAKKAIGIESNDPYISDTLAMLLLKNGDVAEALVHSKAAAVKLPNNAEVQMNYAKVLAANNQKDSAREILKNLLRNTKNYDTRKAISKELNDL
ncbi:MAG: PEP-CTERM system TPR-repeat protein PrsT, partial [Gammaproteobacteria bacterium]|nr:PEP-CTERM system TPR-repeat protein PrsT [Gammaproteobacteria bacterium]